MKNLLFFVAGGCFIVLISFSSVKIYTCQDEAKRLTAEYDSLKVVTAQMQQEAEQQRLEAVQQTVIAVRQRLLAEEQSAIVNRSQEEALIQAESAVQANTEAIRQAALASDYKKQLEACQKKN